MIQELKIVNNLMILVIYFRLRFHDRKTNVSEMFLQRRVSVEYLKAAETFSNVPKSAVKILPGLPGSGNK